MNKVKLREIEEEMYQRVIKMISYIYIYIKKIHFDRVLQQFKKYASGRSATSYIPNFFLSSSFYRVSHINNIFSSTRNIVKI